MLNINLLKQITEVNINYDNIGCCSNDYMGYYMKLPMDIQKHYEYLLQNSDGTVDDKKWIEFLWFEYRIDENIIYYQFIFEDDTVDVTKDFNCDYINNLVLDRYKKEYNR